MAASPVTCSKRSRIGSPGHGVARRTGLAVMGLVAGTALRASRIAMTGKVPKQSGLRSQPVADLDHHGVIGPPR